MSSYFTICFILSCFVLGGIAVIIVGACDRVDVAEYKQSGYDTSLRIESGVRGVLLFLIVAFSGLLAYQIASFINFQEAFKDFDKNDLPAKLGEYVEQMLQQWNAHITFVFALSIIVTFLLFCAMVIILGLIKRNANNINELKNGVEGNFFIHENSVSEQLEPSENNKDNEKDNAKSTTRKRKKENKNSLKK